MTSTETSVDLRLKDETLETPPKSGVLFKSHLDVAPGSYVVRMIVRDSEGQMMSAQNSVVEIAMLRTRLPGQLSDEHVVVDEAALMSRCSG